MSEGTYGQIEFASEFNVSRETMDQLAAYAELLCKWTPSINLISKSTIPTLWDRHFRDSAQVFNILDDMSGHWVDVGTGGGFPGLVLAIMAASSRPDLRFTLVESDRRKSIFLETVIRELELSANVTCARVENISKLDANVVSARALAPLEKLIGYADIHLNTKGKAVFLKGATYRQELDDAKEHWTFQTQCYPSITDPNAAVLCLGEIKRV